MTQMKFPLGTDVANQAIFVVVQVVNKVDGMNLKA